MSNGLNQCTFIGNLGADPETRQSQGGLTIMRLRIAVGERRKKGDEWVDHTEWVPVTVFGKRAESLSKLLSKGDRTAVVGKLRTSSYDDKDGNKRYRTEIVADDVVLCGGKRGGGAPADSGSDDFADDPF